MGHILNSRGIQLGVQVFVCRDAAYVDAAAAQAIPLLRREAPLSPAEVDILEAGLHRTAGIGLQRFLEAGGLEPLLEHTIRPGASQRLERAAGSCPPWMLPPSTGVLVPRAVLLKAILVQVLYEGMFVKIALPSLRTAGRKEAIAGMAQLLLDSQEHELVQMVALNSLAWLVEHPSPSLVTPLQQLGQRKDWFDACCGVLRAVASPPAGSLMQADASLLMEATHSAIVCAGIPNASIVRDFIASPHIIPRRPDTQALAALEPLLSPAAQAVWRAWTQHQAAIAARLSDYLGSSIEDMLWCCEFVETPLSEMAAASLNTAGAVLVVMLTSQRLDGQANSAVLPPRAFLEQVVAACREGQHVGFSKKLQQLYTNLLSCHPAEPGGLTGQAIDSLLSKLAASAGFEAASPMGLLRGLGQLLEKELAQQEVQPGGRSCTQCKQKETKELGMNVCSACRSAWYCSKECQRAAWPDHKAACKKLVAQANGASTSKSAAGTSGTSS